MEISKNAPSWQYVASRFLEAGLSGNRRQLELAAITAIRECKERDPDGASQIAGVLTRHKNGAGSVRGMVIDPPPVDADTTMALVRVEQVTEPQPSPILHEDIMGEVLRFVRQRKESSRLLSEGFLPPSSLLLSGPPGTGKTMLAKWLAAELGLKMATLDLASSISSFLGRTGSNLRRILDYARATPTLLFLDEFDSVAKRRDDSSDVGELKRVVNVLLKELEDWPETSVLVAATNHSSILDPAAFRRFERAIELPLPAYPQRIEILSRSLGAFRSRVEEPLVNAIAALTEGTNGSNLEQLGRAIVRRHLVDNETLQSAALAEVAPLTPKNQKPKDRVKLLREVRALLGEKVPLRVFAALFDLSPSTIHHHLNH